MSQKAPGKIITFYSYKGGTGRSMALANVAWLLASNGYRVLAIDWDLEAPGLHRYFHPFFEDKELGSTRGLIDFVIDFVEAAKTPSTKELGESWYEAYSDLSRYAFSLDWEFPGEGTLDFVPAGRQGPAYSIRVTAMDWRELYEKMGGGLWLEAVKKRLREDYDYILIDSRTGISDTAGICTVQMPDELVVCFTLNQQSIRGAAAIAESAWSQRIKPNGEPALKIWPVPMRVELGEKDRLARAREFARTMFEFYIGHLGGERAAYWEDTEVLYEPFYAYEEVLASFAERHRTRATLLTSIEALASRLAGLRIQSPPMQEQLRLQALSAFTRSETTRGLVFVSYRRRDSGFARGLVQSVRSLYPGVTVWLDADSIAAGEKWEEAFREAVQHASVALVLIGPNWGQQSSIDDWVVREVTSLLEREIPIVPVLTPGAEMPSGTELPGLLRRLAHFQSVRIDTDRSIPKGLYEVLDRVFGPAEPRSATVKADVIRLSRSATNDRQLSAKVTKISNNWFDVLLTVQASNGKPLEGTVIFHLDPSKARPVEPVPVRDGRAVLRFGTWGAFTVGAVADGGRTTLELDLAQLPDAPESFKQR